MDESSESQHIESERLYWRGKLADLPELPLPTDHPRPATQLPHNARVGRTLPQSLIVAIGKFSEQEAVSPVVTLLSALKILLNRSTGQKNIAVASPVNIRNKFGRGGLAGTLINTLVLCTNLEEDPTVRTVLHKVTETTLEAYAHQDYPFEKVMLELGAGRVTRSAPLIPVLFNVVPSPMPGRDFSGLAVTSLPADSGPSQFDITVSLDTASPNRIVMEYSAGLFEERTIQRMLGHYETILAEMVADPQLRLTSIPILTPEERQQLLVDWNPVGEPYPSNTFVHGLIEEQASVVPEQIAVIADGERCTYDGLNSRANALAERLIAEGVGPDSPVGVLARPSVGMVVAILGVLKAGGAYVPLDPDYPPARLAHMVSEAGVRHIVTEGGLDLGMPEFVGRIVHLEGEGRTTPAPNPGRKAVPESLAYIIFTSGSTGKPKGVQVTHHNLLHSTLARKRYYGDPVRSFLLLSPFTFDSSVAGIFWTLVEGGTLVITSREDRMDPARIAAIIERERVTHTLMLPSLYMLVLAKAQKCDITSLQTVIVAGEACPLNLVTEHFRALTTAKLFNEYGPTEAAVWSTVYECTADEIHGSVPIGRPIPNAQAYILDSHSQPVPVGFQGELYIGGDGVARGYTGFMTLTSERFVPNPFASTSGNRLYRTGDLARYLPDGNIEYLGRVDQQVKIRGMRIELQEIETLLGSYPGVRETAVLAREERVGDMRLVAYVVPHEGGAVSPAALRGFLRRSLPEFMVPAHYVIMDSFPLTPNGKVDRQALPRPPRTRPESGGEFTPPRNDLERQLAEIWENVLDVRPIGISDDFFDLGGHSLLAVRLFTELEMKFERKLPLATIFQAPTLGQLASLLGKESWEPPWSCLVPMKGGGSRPPIYFIHGVGGNVLSFRDLARHLHPDQPVYGLQSLGLDGKHAPLVRIEDMASRYVSEIRLLQPKGPYCLGGLSFGGVVAYEMARQLVESGETIGLLALLDTSARPDSANRVKILRDYVIMLGRRGRWHIDHLRKLSAREKVEYVRTSIRNFTGRIRNRYWQLTFDQEQRDEPTLTDILQNVTEGNYVAARRFRARPYAGGVTLFRAEIRGLDDLSDPVEQWKSLASGGVHVIKVPGDHVTMLNEPHVRVLAQRLDECLAKVRA